jgi:arginine-tRNA-protein transferase
VLARALLAALRYDTGMESIYRFLAPPSQCGYLPNQTWRLEYELFAQLTPAEYQERLLQGWRRFGGNVFRPRCPACNACRSLRVDITRFRPNRSQRRLRKANEGIIQLRIGRPSVSQAKLKLYDRYHAYQAMTKDWPWHDPKDAEEYYSSFVANPLPTQEWRYFFGRKLVGVGYVDNLPAGLSAIYFFYDPDYRQHSLGTWNILSLIEHARQRHIPFVYLGYYVAGCPSMEYKVGFAPNQVLEPDGKWHNFREG